MGASHVPAIAHVSRRGDEKGCRVYSDLTQSAILDNPLDLPERQVMRDVLEVQTRFKNEGMYFLCIRLPQLAKALLQSFEEGTLTVPNGFARCKDCQYPAFMQAYWRVIFEDDGSLKEVGDLQQRAARHIWQVTALFSKLEGDVPEELVRSQFGAFAGVQAEARAPAGGLAEEILSLARDIVDEVFANHDPSDQLARTVVDQRVWTPPGAPFPLLRCEVRHHVRPVAMPRHGPGAVAEGTKGQFSKWSFGPVRFARLERVFPWYRFNIPNARAILDPQLRQEWLNKPLEEHGVDRILPVPKDMTKKRIITCSPTSYVYAGQYARSMLLQACMDSPYWPQINTLSQELQRERALKASVDGKSATFDLEQASDRFQLSVVRELFRNQPRWLDMLEACRIPEGVDPYGNRVVFSMYAGMGNATTFVVQTVGYFSLTVAALLMQLGDYSVEARRRMASQVSVFGDDIIAPAWGSDAIVEALTSVGLKVNTRKSFSRGPFRESCGMDALRGVQITPTRIKKLLPTSSADIESALAWSEYAYDLKIKGYGRTWAAIVQVLSELGPLPWVPTGSGVVGLYTTEPYRFRTQRESTWCEEHQVWRVKARHAKTVTRKRQIRGDRRLLRNLLTGESGEVEALRRVKSDWTWVPVS